MTLDYICNIKIIIIFKLIISQISFYPFQRAFLNQDCVVYCLPKPVKCLLFELVLSLSIISYHYQLSLPIIITNYHYQLSVIITNYHYQLLLSIIITNYHYQYHYQLLSSIIITNYHQLLFSACSVPNYLFPRR